ncbi:MAG: leucine-rich repeat domain-containing protein [Clostridiales bacterium]|nr:leucine-rich repeat domain-containing protein [Clostridiales bacterium]
MKKKTWSTMLTLMFVVAAIMAISGITVNADPIAEGQAGDDVHWSIENGILTISGSGPMYDYTPCEQPWYYFDAQELVIENGITYIGSNAFFDYNHFDSVTIPDSVTAIGNDAFNGCGNLKTVNIPDSVTDIGSGVFSQTGIESIVIPDGVTSIKKSTFYQCTSLEDIYIPDSITDIGDYAFSGCTSLKSIVIPEVISSIGTYAFQRCSSLDDVYFLPINSFSWDTSKAGFKANKGTKFHVRGNAIYSFYDSYLGDANLTLVDDLAGRNALWSYDPDTTTLTINGTGDMLNIFMGPYGQPWNKYSNELTTIVISNGITSIGDYSFSYFDEITSVTIPASVTHIGISAFHDCDNITSVNMPGNITGISDYAFYSCNALESVTFGGNPEYIGDYAFYFCEKIESIDLSDGLQSIGSNAFCSCSSLQSIDIPESVTSIGESAFAYCRSMEMDGLPSGLTSLGNSAFSHCEKITSVVIPEGLTVIPNYAFNYSGLTEVTIPEGVTRIGEGAFRNCKIVSLVIPSTVQTWGAQSFYENESLTTLTLTDGLTCIGVDAFEACDALTGLNIPGSVKSVGDHAFSRCTSLGTLTLNEGIESIGYGSFSICQALEYVKLPSTLATMGNFPFNGCDNLKTIVFSDGITTVPDYMLSACSSLETVILPGSITSIGEGAFSGCESLTYVNIPNGIKQIKNSTFESCSSLTTITIPESVELICDNAFHGCISMTDVYCYAYPYSNLWNDSNSDEFKYPVSSEDEKTVCHVPTDYLMGYTSYCNSVNVKFVGGAEEINMGNGNSHLYGYSLSLDGNIGVNFYMSLDEAVTGKNSTAFMLFTVDGRTQKVQVKKLTANDDGYYIFRCNVAAKEMCDQIIAQFYLADGIESGPSYSFTVRDYAAYILNHRASGEIGHDPKVVALVEAMLNYGAYSQIYFGYNTGNLANSILDEPDRTVSAVPVDKIDQYVYTGVTQFNAGNRFISFISASLSTESELVLNFYFKGLPVDTVVTCNGKKLKTRLSTDGSYTKVSITGIKIQDIDEYFTISFTYGGVDCSLTYSPMNYCYNVVTRPLSATRTQELKDEVAALYWFYKAAENYIAN